MTWLHFLRHKSDATDIFKQFLAGIRADSVSSSVEAVHPMVGVSSVRMVEVVTCVQTEVSSESSLLQQVLSPMGCQKLL